ncbi:MAG: PhzF family phenazine biosynthesis protein [Coleofasciculaceae cyanobacterium SM2_1_6]|nr:PhzF family phenazine biosynthesis protein [Coleofasciculaceae cyanobacterium SM2_1_6]
MVSLPFYIVDVFAISKYTGNQLAVCTDAQALSTGEMQTIAREINFSETTFILPQQPGIHGYPVRIFTPKKELPFAGHPTIGTAFILQQKIIQQLVSRVNLNLPIGQIPVDISYQEDSIDLLWMSQRPPTFHEFFNPEEVAAMLNISVDDLDDRFPIQSVSTGIAFIIVPLKNQQSLQACLVDVQKCEELTKNTEAKCVLVFCPETHDPENDLCVRVFAHALGVVEDPATGSANGCLAAYLIQYDYFAQPSIDLKVEQGYEIDRPSLLLLKALRDQEVIQVFVGGKVIMVAQGEFVS